MGWLTICVIRLGAKIACGALAQCSTGKFGLRVQEVWSSTREFRWTCGDHGRNSNRVAHFKFMNILILLNFSAKELPIRSGEAINETDS
jgi:hypothetical protein